MEGLCQKKKKKIEEKNNLEQELNSLLKKKSASRSNTKLKKANKLVMFKAINDAFPLLNNDNIKTCGFANYGNKKTFISFAKYKGDSIEDELSFNKGHKVINLVGFPDTFTHEALFKFTFEQRLDNHLGRTSHRVDLSFEEEKIKDLTFKIIELLKSI